MALAISSVLSGLTEAGILAVVAQVAATSLVTGRTLVRIDVGPLHLDATIGALLAVAFVLAIIRLALQMPISYLPARISADVQARLRTGACSMPSRRPPGMCSRATARARCRRS